MTSTAAAIKARRHLPILGGILPFDRSRLMLDIIAGATLAALAMPEVMGYTKIAEMPVITGLYTLVLPVVAFALLGSSRHLVVGADSATAAVMATGLAGITAAGAPASPQWVAMAGLAAIMCGVFLLIARLIRLGFIANFLSHSVLIGFLTGVGIQVALGQVGGLFGISEGSGTTLQKFVNALQGIAAGETSFPTLAVSLTVLAVIVGLGRVNKKIPGALIAVVGMIVASYLFDFVARGITTIGAVPSGLPPIGLPAIGSDQLLADVSALLPVVFSMFILILAQSAATSRAYAMKYDDSFNENVDLVGLGASSLAAGLSGTFVVNGSPTKTEMVDSAGGRSQISMLTTGVIVVVVLLFLTVPLSYMPNAVLSAVVFLIGLKLVDIKGMRSVLRVRPGEFAVGLITAATVVLVGVEQGIILAIILSVVIVVAHVYKPNDRIVSFARDGSRVFGPVTDPVEAEPGLVIYAFGAELFYANASRFSEEIVGILEGAQQPIRWLAIDAAAIADLDYSGADSVRQIFKAASEHGAKLVFCSMDASVRTLFNAYGLTELIGSSSIFVTVAELVAAYRAADGATTTASSD